MNAEKYVYKTRAVLKAVAAAPCMCHCRQPACSLCMGVYAGASCRTAPLSSESIPQRSRSQLQRTFFPNLSGVAAISSIGGTCHSAHRMSPDVQAPSGAYRVARTRAGGGDVALPALCCAGITLLNHVATS